MVYLFLVIFTVITSSQLRTVVHCFVLKLFLQIGTYYDHYITHVETVRKTTCYFLTPISYLFYRQQNIVSYHIANAV